MKLTKPPEVHELPAERVEQLRSGLVRQARRKPRPRPVPRWGPVVAAAAGVATVAVGIANLDRLRAEPVPLSPATTSPRIQVTPPKTQAVNLDLGAAGADEARQMVEQCLKTGRPSIKPDEDYTIAWARWITKLVSKTDGNWVEKSTRQMVAVVRSEDRQREEWCQDGTNTGGGSLGASAWDEIGGMSHGEGGASKQPGHPWTMVKKYSLAVGPNIGHVEVRLRWQGGSTPWYAGYVDVNSLTGYVEVTATGRTGTPPEKATVDARAFDASGKQVYTHSGDQDLPLFG